MELVILAGGIGSRYGGTKQMDAFGPDGAWLMDYGIYDAHQAGFGRAVVICQRHNMAIIEQHLMARWGQVMEIAVVNQPKLVRDKPWGTGHALLQAQPYVQGCFGMINADDFYGKEAYTQLYNFVKQAPSHTWALVGYPLLRTLSAAGAVSRGICHLDDSGALLRIEERAHLDATSAQHIDGVADLLVSMNAWGCSPQLFEILQQGWEAFYTTHKHDPKQEYLLPTAIQNAMTQGIHVQVLPTTSQWMGVTYADDKPYVDKQLHQLHEQHAYPLPLTQ